MKEYPYWHDTIPPDALTTERLDDRRGAQFDVAIVGAGYTGLAAARHLARIGASVIVLERHTVGFGASSRNGGQVLTGLKLDPATLVARYGEKRARRIFDAAVQALDRLEAVIREHAIDCGYTRSGHIQAAWKPSHFRAFREEQALLARVFDHRVELVPPGEQRTEIGTDAYHGLLVDERSGAINPAQYVIGLARAATAAGARVVAGVDVLRVSRRGADVVVSTAIGEMHARDVLWATNGYTGAASPALRRRFVPIGSFAIATDPLGEPIAQTLLPRKRMAFDTKNFLYYFRVTDDRRLLFGGRAEFAEPGTDTVRRAAAILRDGMVQIFPELRDVPIAYAWGGNVAFTRDQLPHAGLLDDGYFAGGYCGHGIAMATTLGEQIARRLAGEPIEHPFIDDRFDPIPFYDGRPWFLPLVGAYYRFLDYVQ